MVENWTVRKRPMRLERRVEFDNYELTRDFLDLTAELSEKQSIYPDMNFGRTHVSMTIHCNDELDHFEDSQLSFAEQINGFAPSNKMTAALSAQCSPVQSSATQ
ncbi:pterin-4-alpha-carbinolamine dehydratase [Pseudomonadota bacterium]